MTKVSRKPLPKEDWEEFFDQICGVLTWFENKKQMKWFLNDLLTRTEKKMFSKRLQIARELLNGETYEAIGKRLNVTDNTIASVNDTLSSIGDGYREAHEILKQLEREDIERTKEKIAKLENPINTRRTTVLGELAKVGTAVVGKKLHQRQRRKSVRKDRKKRKTSRN